MRLMQTPLLPMPVPGLVELSVEFRIGRVQTPSLKAGRLVRADTLSLVAVFDSNRAGTQRFKGSSLPASLILLAADYADTAAPVFVSVGLSNPPPNHLVVDITPNLIPQPGAAHLAGPYPDNGTKVEGVPSSALIRVHLRDRGQPSDGVLVAEVQSGSDGAWRVDGLESGKRYDVICRYDGFNDLILSNVLAVGLVKPVVTLRRDIDLIGPTITELVEV